MTISVSVVPTPTAPGLLFHRDVMDDAALRLLILISLALPFGSRAADLTYVTPVEVDQLRAKFAAAHLSAADVSRLAAAKGWRCSMFGVRTRLQVHREVDLYHFSEVTPASTLKNVGAQPIAAYEFKGESLRGLGDQGLLDEIKMSSESELIAKLSLPERGVTVAYAVCHGS